jgi:hypothetical protein
MTGAMPVTDAHMYLSAVQAGLLLAVVAGSAVAL